MNDEHYRELSERFRIARDSGNWELAMSLGGELFRMIESEKQMLSERFRVARAGNS